MQARLLPVLLLFNCLWAGLFVMYKHLVPVLSPGGIVTLRYTLAALVLAVLWPWLPGANPRGADLLRLAVMGTAVFGLGHRLQVWANQAGTAGNSAVLMAVEPLVTSVLAALFLREHITARGWAGLAMGVVGVLGLSGVFRPEFHWSGLLPSVLFVTSFVCETAYSIVSKPMMARVGLWKVLGGALIAGALANWLFDGAATARSLGALSSRDWLMIVYMGPLCTVLGYAVWLAVIRIANVNLAALTIFVQPIAGIPFASYFLGEAIKPEQIWGSLIIGAGLLIGLWPLRNGTSQATTQAAPRRE